MMDDKEWRLYREKSQRPTYKKLDPGLKNTFKKYFKFWK